MRRIAVGFAVALVAGATGCAERGPSAPGERNATLPAGMFVSNARLNAGNAVSSSGLRSSLGVSAGNVAFVSAAPGTFANATSASVYNRSRGGASLLIQVKDGGFDPVGVNAEVGDELSLAVSIAGGEPMSLVLKVPPRRPPEVVRTTPPKGRTDVALNVQVVVVFSEPVSASSLTSSSFALLQNQIPVKGAVRLSADGLTAEFVPDGPLEPQTSYSLVVSGGVRDLDGDALSGAWTTSFTTSGEVAGTGTTVPALSGTIAFVSTREGQPHIYLANAGGTAIRRLTNRTEPEFTPSWSPDGQRLAFNSGDGGTYVINRDGTELKKLPNGGGWPSWSPDSKQLIVTNAAGNGLRILDLSGSVAGDIVIDLAFGGGRAGPWSTKWSPVGQKIAFGTWLDGPDFQRVYVANIDGSGAVAPIVGSTIWDECGPVWSPDGQRIALLTGLHGVAVVTPGQGTPSTMLASPGTFCWDGSYGTTRSGSGVDWSPDGTQLAITTRVGTNPSITFVDIQSRAIRLVIPDAYDPAWSR